MAKMKLKGVMRGIPPQRCWGEQHGCLETVNCGVSSVTRQGMHEMNRQVSKARWGWTKM